MVFGVPWFVWVTMAIFIGLFVAAEYSQSFKQFLAEVEEFRAEAAQPSQPEEQRKKGITPESWNVDP